MNRRAGAILVAASAGYLLLTLSTAAKLGAGYEEAVAYVLTQLDVRDWQPTRAEGRAPRFVVSEQLPRLAFETTPGVQLPLLNQPYMTDHLSYGGVALAAAGFDRLYTARVWHALFGLALLWILYDVALLLGYSRRAAGITVVVAATSVPFTFMYSWARFDESLASWGSVAVLWAALRRAQGGGQRWTWIGVLSAALAVSAKLTATWPLAGLAVAGALAGWRPPPLRKLALPLLVSAPLFAPMIGFAVAGPATAREVNRRLAFLSDLFTSDAIPGTAANLIDYLGNWSGILSRVIRGADAAGANWCGWLIMLCTMTWLVLRTFGPGPVPRRHRLEAQMLAFTGVIFILVVFFYHEHRDYQFVLVVPLFALAVARFLEWCARWLDQRIPAAAAAVLVCLLPVGSNLWEQARLNRDLTSARNAMFDQGVQRAAADWLAANGAHRPIVATFYEVGTYELFTGGVVRPVYAFPMLRHAKGGNTGPDLTAVWRQLLGDGGEPRFAVLPLGENPIEAQHFDEPAIRAALLQVTAAKRVAVFSNRLGEPLLEIWETGPNAATPNEPAKAG